MRYLLTCMVLLLLPHGLTAQEDDKSYLTRLLQDSLAGEGRDVQITGFRGALSSEATIDKVTVADEAGIWLTLTDLTLQWSRSALLRGVVDIQTLSAKSIQLERGPKAEDTGLPSPEAQPFSIPEFPVSIQLEALKVDEITIGAPLLGEELRLSLKASAALADGDASIDLTAQRIDGETGLFKFAGAFVESTEDLKIDLALREAADGITAKLLDLPGTPSVDLKVAGEGLLSDFTTDILLATDGAERLAGQITLGTADSLLGLGTPARLFSADLGGDVTALFAPKYRKFFGDDVTLRVSGQREENGALEIAEMQLAAQELNIEGGVSLNADQWPTRIDLIAELAGTDAVLLPIKGPPTEVKRAMLNISYAVDESNGWTAALDVDELDRAGMAIGALQLKAGGMLEGEVGALGRVTADVRFAAEDLTLADPALADAVGRDVVGTFKMGFVEGEPLSLTGLDVQSAAARLTGAATVDDLESGFSTDLEARLETSDLSKFTGLAGRDLGGAADLALKGNVALGGQFDLLVTGSAQNLAIDQPQADTVLRGETALRIVARRGTDGIFIEEAVIENPQISLGASGRFATDDSEAIYALRLAEFGEIAEALPGPLTVHGNAQQDAAGWRVDLTATGPHAARAKINGLATGPDARIFFDAGLPDIRPLVPAHSGALALKGTLAQSPDGWVIDTALEGPYALTADVTGNVTGTAPRFRYTANLPDIQPVVPGYTGPLDIRGTAADQPEGWRIDAELDGPYGLTAEVAGTATGDAPAFNYSARLPDTRPFVPQISGALSVDGTARQTGGAWAIDTDVSGPAGTQAKVAGTIASGDEMKITAKGSAPLGLADPFLRPRSVQGTGQFDLVLNGAPSLAALSGRISTSAARFVLPNLFLALTGMDASVDLNGGRASVAMSSGVSGGGRLSVNGPVTLTGAMPADIQISLANVVLADPSLYRTTVNGALNVTGALQGGALIAGRLNLGETNVKVPTSGMTSFGALPPITHNGASREVLVTQRKAGIGQSTDTAPSGSGVRYPLDITISAPSRIFVRGRGLDAELGGELRLTGTTADMISAGRFDLIRGRLDILEKRFDLDEGSAMLQGDMNPYVRFVARTETDTGTASIIVEGPANAPEVTFSSVPEAPQDEVLSQIFFSRDITQLSPLQAAQLASAIATLAGRGGEGIVTRLRRSFGVDDLDITSDEEGNTGVRVGKYISDNVYTDVETTGDGVGKVSLNIDLTRSITASGSVDSENESTLGIFFQKDY